MAHTSSHAEQFLTRRNRSTDATPYGMLRVTACALLVLTVGLSQQGAAATPSDWGRVTSLAPGITVVVKLTDVDGLSGTLARVDDKPALTRSDRGEIAALNDSFPSLIRREGLSKAPWIGGDTRRGPSTSRRRLWRLERVAREVA